MNNSRPSCRSVQGFIQTSFSNIQYEITISKFIILESPKSKLRTFTIWALSELRLNELEIRLYWRKGLYAALVTGNMNSLQEIDDTDRATIPVSDLTNSRDNPLPQVYLRFSEVWKMQEVQILFDQLWCLTLRWPKMTHIAIKLPHQLETWILPIHGT